MSITLADARQMAEAEVRPAALRFKDASTSGADAGQMLALDDVEGIVTAIVSVTGCEDEVKDIIEAGAYRETLTKRRPKVCWAHSWERPVGRVLHIEELLPGDERLPQQTKDGKPWPKEAGALVATMQFNMRSEEGKSAFEAVRFYSESGECEYSIGYQVPPGRATRDKAGVRHIKSLELYELSVVLFGAHTMTGTISIKAAVEQMRSAHNHGRSAKDVLASLMQSKDVQDFADGVMVAVYPDPDAADRIASAIAGPDNTTPKDELHVTLAYLGKTSELGVTSDDVFEKVRDAVEGLPVIEGQIGGIGTFPDSGDGAPTWVPVDVPGLSMLREQVAEALGDLVATDHGFTPHMTIGYDIGLPEPIENVPVTFSEVRVVWGTQDRRIPLGSGQPEQKGATMDTTEAEVKALLDSYTADDWTALAADVDSALVQEVKARTPGGREGDASPVGTPGGRQNWVDKAGGLPKYIRMVAHALKRHGHSDSSAIAIAVATMKRWAANAGGKVTEKVQAAAAAALAEWEKMKAQSHASKSMLDHYDPSAEDKAIPVADGVKSYPRLPGTYEERIEAVRCAVHEALRGDPIEDGGSRPGGDSRYEWDHVSIEGTWPNRVVATRIKWSDGDDGRESFEMPYELTDQGVALGEPEQVEMQVTLAPVDNGETEPDGDWDDNGDWGMGDAMPFAEDLMTMASAFNAVRMESKAGRVLSGANERKLRDAVENLLKVLEAAGVMIDPPGAADSPDGHLPDTDPRKEIPPGVDLSSTAPSAQIKDGMVHLEVADLEATLADLGI